jgi:hypothetical protein
MISRAENRVLANIEDAFTGGNSFTCEQEDLLRWVLANGWEIIPRRPERGPCGKFYQSPDDPTAVVRCDYPSPDGFPVAHDPHEGSHPDGGRLAWRYNSMGEQVIVRFSRARPEAS